MDFTLTKEQEMVRNVMKEFAENEVSRMDKAIVLFICYFFIAFQNMEAAVPKTAAFISCKAEFRISICPL